MRLLSLDFIKKQIGTRVVKNAIWLYLLQFFDAFLPLITLPYITRILGAEQYGAFNVVLNWVGYLQVLVVYGFGLSATRKASINDGDPSKLFSSVLASRVVLWILSLLITGAGLLLSNSSEQERIGLCILTIGLGGLCIQVNWLFQGKQDMKFISITSVTARFITTAGIFLFVRKPEHIIIYCILYTLSPVISNTIGLIIARIKYRVRFVKVSWGDIFACLKEGSYVFFTQLSSKVFGAIGVTFLGMWASNADVGVYSAINKVPYVLLLLWGPISQIIYPISSKKLNEDFFTGVDFVKKVQKYVILVFACFSLVLCLLSEPIISVLFGKEYSQYYFLTYPLFLWLLMGIENNFLGIQLMIGSGYDKEYAQCFQIGVAATVILNACLIYIFGIYGAATAPFLSELFLAFLLKLTFKKIKKTRL